MNTNRWLASLKNSFALSGQRRRRKQKTDRTRMTRAHAAEVLENKVLLTGIDCLGQIQGVAYQDLNGNGMQEMGEPGLSNAGDGVEVHLFSSTDMNFDSAGMNGTADGDDTFVATALPDANGNYSFPGLAAGTYFVEQPMVVGFNQRTGDDVSGPIVISAADAEGVLGDVVDDFSLPALGQQVMASSALPDPDSGTATVANVLGGERDLFVDLVAGPGALTLSANNFTSEILELSGTASATGFGTVTWDGLDADATNSGDQGMLGVDLTNGGDTTGFRFDYGADKAGQMLTLTVYDTTGNSASEAFTIPDTGGTPDVEVYSPFSDFAGVDFSDIGAIELRIDATITAFQGQVSFLQTQGPTIIEADFANSQPMTLGGTVFEDLNNSGTFQVGTEGTINNVAVTLFGDLDDDGMIDDEVGTTTTTSGDYSFTNLFPGDYIVRIDDTNFAAAGALEGLMSSTGNGVAPDPDAGPNLDNDDNGDHIGGTTTAIVSQAITLVNNDEPEGASNNTNNTLDFGVFGSVDIAVTKIDNAALITAGSGVGNLIYTITAQNLGPSDATGVQITDPLIAGLPTGWSFVSADDSGTTTFDENSGVWNIGNLPFGGTPETLTVTITVGSSAIATTTTNEVTVTAVNETDSNPDNDVAEEDTTVIRSVDVAVTKIDNAALITAGSGVGNLIYTITAQNLGPSDATGVQITDPLIAGLPTGWSFVSADDSGTTTFDETTGLWNIGSLPFGGTPETLTVTITVGSNAIATTTTNTVTVTAVTETDSNPDNNVATEDTTVVRSVDVSVEKVDNAALITAGSGVGNLIYTITAQNLGPSDATGVQITDPLIAGLPTGWSFVSADDSGTTTFDETTGLWNIGSLPFGGTPETLTVTITVGSNAIATTTTNTVTVTVVTETDSNPDNNVATEDTTVVRFVDISLDKTDNEDPITAGSGLNNLVYTVTATNLGLSDATGVTVSDPLITNLPTGWTLESAVGTNGTTFGAGVWNIGDLPRGLTETLTLTLSVGVDAENGTTRNEVSVATVNEVDNNADNDVANEDTTVVREADVGVLKSDDFDPVTAGSGDDNLTYTITAENFGPSDASGLAVTDTLFPTLPTGWVLEESVGTNGTTFDPTTGIWTIGDLAFGEDETLTLTFTVGASAESGTTTNTVEVSNLNEVDNNADNDVANEDTTVVREADVGVLKSDDFDPVTAGSGDDNLTYTITAENFGPSNASGLTVTDTLFPTLPTGWILEESVGTNGTTFDPTTGIWTIGDLPFGEDETLTLTFTVGASAESGTTTNTVEVSNLNEVDNNADNDVANEDTTVVREADVGVLKSDDFDPVTAGSGDDNLTYTITAENFGPSDASGLTVTDTLFPTLPTGWVLEESVGTNGTTFDPTTGVWTIGDLAFGEDETLTLTFTVGVAAESGTTTNTVEVSNLNEVDNNADNDVANEDTTVVREADVGVLKSDDFDPVTAGSGDDNLTYTITAENFGPSDASGLTVTDTLFPTLPTGWVLEESVGTNGTTFDPTTGIWTIGDLAFGEDETLTLTFTVGASAESGTTTNTVEVSNLNEVDNNADNDVANEDTTVVRAVDIEVLKSDNQDPIVAGSGAGNLVYTVTARNFGPSNASGVTVSDELITDLPPGWIFVSGVGSNGSEFDDDTGIWDIGELRVGVPETLTLTITVDPTAVSGTTDNTVQVAMVNETDNNADNDIAVEDTTIVREVDIEVLKSDNVDPVTAGSGVGQPGLYRHRRKSG